MPLYLTHNEEKLQWGVWKTEESVEELLSLLPNRARYDADLQRFTAEHRRKEWLAVRALLYTLLGEEKVVAYLPSGKPYLQDHSFRLGISHTHGYVAVILGREEAESGIDIEQYGERVCRVAHKFMGEDELRSTYLGSDTWSLLLHWSAKEVMFKCMNTAEVDFRKHLRIDPFRVQEAGVIRATAYRTDHRQEFLIRYLVRPHFVLTWQ